MSQTTAFGRKLSRKKHRKYRFRRLRVEFIENGLSEDHDIHTSYLRSAFIEVRKTVEKRRLRRLWVEFLEHGLSEVNKILRTYLRQSTSQSCRTKPNQLLPVGCKILPFTRPPSLYPNRIWRHQLLSGRHFSKFEKKRPKMPPPSTLDRILVARRFACHTNRWASYWSVARVHLRLIGYNHWMPDSRETKLLWIYIVS